MHSFSHETLLRDGFCTVPDVLDPAMLERLTVCTDRWLAARDAKGNSFPRSTGSMLSVFDNPDPVFPELISWPKALQALADLGYPNPTFSDGYVISKPAHGPRLFWHYDWFSWEDETSYGPEPQQLFLMYYLTDTSRANGCLRAIPGSHVRHNALHDLLAEPHSKELHEAKNMDRAEFSDRPDEIDVPAKAGDLLIGDSRLLHAAHDNQTDGRRTLITLWYQPEFERLPGRIQAQMVAKTGRPDSWPEDARRGVEPLLASRRYRGNDVPYPRSLYRKR
jgi:hypothetical protein